MSEQKGLTPVQKQQLMWKAKAAPYWTETLPYCSEGCPQHDGKRCMLMGFKPGSFCEPALETMTIELAKYAPFSLPSN